jgi:hypothetical protein
MVYLSITSSHTGKIYHSGVAPLFISAEVIWSNILSSDEKNTLLGVGLRFIEVPDKERQFLHDFVTVYTDPMLN